MKEGHLKSLAKAASWRITASTETMLLGWLVTGSWKAGLSIASIEMITKFGLYYIHERAWLTIPKLLTGWTRSGGLILKGATA